MYISTRQIKCPKICLFSSLLPCIYILSIIWINDLKFWIMLAPFGSVQLTLDQFGSLWISSAHFEPVWLTLDQFGSLWISSAHFGSVWLTLDQFVSLWISSAHFGSVCLTLDRSSHFGSIELTLVQYNYLILEQYQIVNEHEGLLKGLWFYGMVIL